MCVFGLVLYLVMHQASCSEAVALHLPSSTDQSWPLDSVRYYFLKQLLEGCMLQ